MAHISGASKFTLRLVVDEEKNKVVLAEAGKDFLDVLFGLLTLPMGTIMSLLEKHRKSEAITFGSFGNLYKSVVDMSNGDFETEACKEILLYPRSLREVQCKSLELAIYPINDLKYYTCSNFASCNMCSNFSTSWCRCGLLMKKEIRLSDSKAVGNIQNGVFTSSRFIITDDFRMEVKSTELVLEKLKSLGYGDLSKLGERRVDIGFVEVLTLLDCTFSSNAPLTDTFLNKQIPRGVMTVYDLPSPCVKKNGDAEKLITFSVFLRKHDMKILFVECREDFVDLLFTFLALPLDYVLELLSGKSSTFGCIGNLFKIFKDLTPAATEVSISKSVIPHYYKCQKQLLDIITDQPPVYYRYRIYCYTEYRLTTNSNQSLIYFDDKLVPVVLMDPKTHGFNQATEGSGFVKRDTKFTVSDDLVVTPINSTSTFCLLKKLQIHTEDIEVQEMSISKTEAMNLLRASLVTSSALNTVLRNLILKKPKHET